MGLCRIVLILRRNMNRTKRVVTLRREQAEARQAEYNKLTIEQKIAKAGKKEKAKLLAKQANG